ncbi:hypothetical protein Pfo_018566 [Paulownia fortunei]|nr:hypothetical protein Pfo_018566 [Paulownia fortunei]
MEAKLTDKKRGAKKFLCCTRNPEKRSLNLECLLAVDKNIICWLAKKGTLKSQKIQCRFMCFCKPSAAHLYTSGPLKLENTPHLVPSTAYAVSDVSDKSSSGVEEEGVKEEGVEEEGVCENHEAESVLKSCIRKLPSRTDSTKEIPKKRVQWKDNIGKELVEIKEFESSETGDTDNEEESSRCLCVIL